VDGSLSFATDPTFVQGPVGGEVTSGSGAYEGANGKPHLAG
jgi:hypothetical protein